MIIVRLVPFIILVRNATLTLTLTSPFWVLVITFDIEVHSLSEHQRNALLTLPTVTPLHLPA